MTTKLDKVRAVRSVDTTGRVILPKAQETPTCNNYLLLHRFHKNDQVHKHNFSLQL